MNLTDGPHPIYLASRSPRRQELLTQLGIPFEEIKLRVAPGRHRDVVEEALDREPALHYVERIARTKAQVGWKRMVQRNLPQAPVLAADTTVALGDRIFGKPESREDAAKMLAALSGKRHEVLTAVALAQGEWLESALSVSEVEFKALADDEIRQYVATGECDDKAGAYAIQGRAARFVVELRGSYSGVMGLPLYETGRLLDKLPQRR